MISRSGPLGYIKEGSNFQYFQGTQYCRLLSVLLFMVFSFWGCVCVCDYQTDRTGDEVNDHTQTPKLTLSGPECIDSLFIRSNTRRPFYTFLVPVSQSPSYLQLPRLCSPLSDYLRLQFRSSPVLVVTSVTGVCRNFVTIQKGYKPNESESSYHIHYTQHTPPHLFMDPTSRCF